MSTVPYGTSVFQVGESQEQNGILKIESKTATSYTVTGKAQAGLHATLERSNIFRIVNVA
jgi:hypothetical protein